MSKYIIGEIFSSRGATLYKNPSDQTVPSDGMGCVQGQRPEQFGPLKESSISVMGLG